MGKEIERKFLVTGDAWRADARGAPIRQGYLCASDTRSVRVRRKGDEAFFTVKGRSVGATRSEFEYPIPLEDAEAMLDELCERPLIEKTRYALDVGDREWVIDVFAGENDGLIVAEVELESEDDPLSPPDWIGEEVTRDPRYLNVNLVKRPYRSWNEGS